MLALAVSVAGCGNQKLAGLCAPEGAPIALTHAEEPEPSAIYGYWDGSESIAGYIEGSTTSVRPLGDVQRLFNELAASSRNQVHWKRFGTRIAPMPGSVDAANPNFYRCAACDNQESRIDAVLDEIAADERPGLRVIVSDLWLSNSAFTGSAEVALGTPIRRILAGKDGRLGRTIGVIGIRAPYRGPVYDVPGVGTYRGATERPLFVVLIGDRRDVLGAYRTLTTSQSPSFAADRVRFAWFGPEPTADWLGASPDAVISGTALPAELLDENDASQLLQVEASLGDLQAGRASVTVPIDISQRIIPGSVWRGQASAYTRVWRHTGEGCGDAWQPSPPLRNAVRPNDPAAPERGAALVLDGQSMSGLLPGHTYLITGSFTTTTVASDPPETRWMRDWGVSPERAPLVARQGPSFFPALNLEALSKVLETGVSDQQPEGGRPLATFAVLVQVKP